VDALFAPFGKDQGPEYLAQLKLTLFSLCFSVTHYGLGFSVLSTVVFKAMALLLPPEHGCSRLFTLRGFVGSCVPIGAQLFILWCAAACKK